MYHVSLFVMPLVEFGKDNSLTYPALFDKNILMLNSLIKKIGGSLLYFNFKMHFLLMFLNGMLVYFNMFYLKPCGVLIH